MIKWYEYSWNFISRQMKTVGTVQCSFVVYELKLGIFFMILLGLCMWLLTKRMKSNKCYFLLRFLVITKLAWCFRYLNSTHTPWFEFRRKFEENVHFNCSQTLLLCYIDIWIYCISRKSTFYNNFIVWIYIRDESIIFHKLLRLYVYGHVLINVFRLKIFNVPYISNILS